jgi:hopanoid biosynthesis associated protein HpnK
MKPDSPVSQQVVVNADDFGLHKTVNKAIVQGHKSGVVTSTSIMACGSAFEDAVEQGRTCPGLGIGVHLTLVEERPVAVANQVPSIVNRSGVMHDSYADFARRWLSHQIRLDDVIRELEAQVERVLRAGITPTHFDSHQHVHCLPGLWKVTVDLAKKYRVPYVRLPYFDSIVADATIVQSAIRLGVNVLGTLRRNVRAVGVRHADHVRGFAFSGQMTPVRLLSILKTIGPGLTEIMVHPGLPDEDLRKCYRQWKGFSWEQDYEAVTDPSVIKFCAEGGITLTNFVYPQEGNP